MASWVAVPRLSWVVVGLRLVSGRLPTAYWLVGEVLVLLVEVEDLELVEEVLEKIRLPSPTRAMKDTTAMVISRALRFRWKTEKRWE